MSLRDAPFRPGWALTLQAAAAVAIVLALAIWQLSRALEKTALRDARVERLRADAVGAAAVSGEAPADFTRVAFTGVYDARRHFLVAARGGRGFDVFTPFAAKEGVFLVNRGWWIGAAAPDSAPTVPTPTTTVTVVGVAWPLPRPSRLAAAEQWPAGWPKRLRWGSLVRMAAEVGAREREFRLERGGAGVFRAAPLAWDHAPGTHWGYMAQWLLIGAALAGGYVFVGKRRGRRLAAARPAE